MPDTTETSAYEETFAQVLHTYAGAIERLALANEYDAELRQDLIQDIHLALWRSLKTFKQAASLKTFVYRVIQNTIFNHIAYRARINNTESIEETLVYSTACTLENTAQLKRQNDLLRAIKRLPNNQQQVTLLTFEGLSYQEISDVLGLSRSNIGLLLHRSKKQLQQLLREHHDD